LADGNFLDAREAARLEAEQAKREAADAACAELPESGVIGLGSGSTARIFIDRVGALVRAGRKLSGVPTPEASRKQAEGLGIPLLADDARWDIAVTVDGADEVDASLNLIKGGGAAHTREKIVNFASRRNIIVVDGSKLSTRLGEKWPVPIEVLRFGHVVTAEKLARLGRPVLRLRDGQAVVTDVGNFIYDLHTGPIDDPAALDCALRAIAGVVETGLFVGRADVVLVGEHGHVRRIEPELKPRRG
jgi:ribose 5-phosphate isomerase A